MKKFIVSTLLLAALCLPAIAAESVPYSFAFTGDNQSAFESQWTTGCSADARSSYNKWSLQANYNYVNLYTYSWSSDDFENHWLISPELNFDKAGEYNIVYNGIIKGRIELMVGTGTANVDGYTAAGSFENATADLSTYLDYTATATITEPGTYRIAVRACAGGDQDGDYRLRSLMVYSNTPVPALPDNFVAVADKDDNLSANLSWTNPVLDTKGQPLESISKIELYRNDVLVSDNFNLTPGAAVEFTDNTITTAGTYSYNLLVYNENGYNPLAKGVIAEAGYVGKPMATLPYSLSFLYETEAMKQLTIVDANNDGITWQYVKGSWTNEMVLEPTTMVDYDDYLITPYFHLQAGYYVLDYSVTAQNNSLEVGFLTKRNLPVESSTPVYTHSNDYTCSGPRIFHITEDGDYAVYLRATGSSNASYYLKYTVSSIKLDKKIVAPTVVTDLEATNDGLTVTLKWTNPTLDNVGNALESLNVMIERNGMWIDEVLNLAPGATCTYQDVVSKNDDYEYRVTTFNDADGVDEVKAPTVSLFVGVPMVLPYETVDFSDWTFETSYSGHWELNPDTKFAEFEFDQYATNYQLFTPLFSLEAGNKYTLEAIFDGHFGGEDWWGDAIPAAEQYMRFVSSPNRTHETAQELTEFVLPAEAKDYLVTLTLVPQNEAEEVSEGEVIVPATPVFFGFHTNNGYGVGNMATLKSFKISSNTQSGITDADAGAVVVLGNVVCYSHTADITVTDIAGRVLRHVNAQSIDLGDLKGAGIVIVSAQGFAPLKLAL